MPEFDPKIAELEARLDRLIRTQIDFQKETNAIRRELEALRGVPEVMPPQQDAPRITNRLEEPRWVPPAFQRQTPFAATDSAETGTFPLSNFGDEVEEESVSTSGGVFSDYFSSYVEAARADLEKFIGENLISLIGTIILVLGVGIGAKYAIDNGWISPLMRIIFGYAMGLGLLAVAIRLKAKYHNFSAVLLSGGMAIMYFVTYFAYAYYSLMPQSAAFVLMAIFTAFTVAAAILYNRQVIAHIGLVGAYAVPFLLSDGSGNYLFLFTYMAILNGGILAISVKKYWRSIFYTSFVFTWVIFGSWFSAQYDQSEHFVLAAVFASIFFAIFYGVAFAYRLVNDKTGLIENAGQVFAASFVYYGFGYAILDSRGELQRFEGLFTAMHALLHSAVAQTVSRIRPNANDVVQVLAVLIITFTTIAIPVQFDGNYVTLIWTVEAAVLFWFGRARLIPLFEYCSYPLMLFATCSIFIDWMTAYGDRTSYVSEFNRQPLVNGEFVTALVFVAAFAFIYAINEREHDEPVIGHKVVRPLGLLIGAVGLFVLYNTFRIEISNYYDIQAAALAGRLDDAIFVGSSDRYDPDISRFSAIWQINYTMAFLAAVGLANLRKVRSKVLAFANIGFGFFGLMIFFTAGMGFLYVLQESYMSDASVAGLMNIVIRYISYAIAASLLYVYFEYSRSELLSGVSFRNVAFEVILCATIFILGSCELINLMEQLHVRDADRLGLSILWGVYALALIAVGIAQHKKRSRVAAIVLLAVTLIKLFLYDVADLATIPKTILFISLGLLMLLVSFLYNKYVDVIFGTEAKQER